MRRKRGERRRQGEKIGGGHGGTGHKKAPGVITGRLAKNVAKAADASLPAVVDFSRRQEAHAGRSKARRSGGLMTMIVSHLIQERHAKVTRKMFNII
ncbi:MAG TPA: hypothetical protein VIO38_07775, partial [Rariglobus sp.]